MFSIDTINFYHWNYQDSIDSSGIASSVMYVNTTQGRIFVCGSLTKYLYYNNVTEMKPSDFARAVHKLTDEFSFDPNMCFVTRIDISVNVETRNNSMFYGDLLVSAGWKNRKPVNESFYMQNNSKTILIYDKIEETCKYSQGDKHLLPKESNLTRVEIRFNRDLKGVFNRKVTLSDLYDPIFLNQLSEQGVKEFSGLKWLRNDAMSRLKRKGVDMSAYDNNIHEYLRIEKEKAITKSEKARYRRLVNSLTVRYKDIMEDPQSVDPEVLEFITEVMYKYKFDFIKSVSYDVIP